MAVCVDVAADAVDRGVVGRNRTVEVEPQNLSHVRRPVARGDLSRGGQILGSVRRAVIREPVAAVVAARQIQLLIGPEYQPPTAVIVVRREVRDEIERAVSANFAVSYVYRRTFNLRESAGPASAS